MRSVAPVPDPSAFTGSRSPSEGAGAGARANPIGGDLIGGEWAPSEAGGRFTLVEPLPPFEALGSWPTSGLGDLERALAACAGAREWSARSWSERERPLRGAASAFVDDADCASSVARRLGLAPEELEEHRVAGAERGFDGLERARGSAAAPGEVALVVPDWSELYLGTFRRTARELLAGRAVLLLADPRLPQLADGLARALLGAGLPAESLALLHAPTWETVEQAVADRRIRALSGSGPRERVAGLRRVAHRARLPEQRLWMPRATSYEVDPRRGLEREAERVLDAAFGRARTLSGQLDGQVGRVFCPERAFSAFTSELLGRLEGSPEAREPVPLIDRQARKAVERVWGTGLDGGATLIHGGERLEGPVREGLRVAPSVFTNVEPGMPWARRAAPVPVLGLLRSPSSSSGGEGRPGER